MSPWFTVLTVVFIIVSAAMVLIILVQRSQGGGLAGAFGGAGGSGTETVFGGRVGDALTMMTIVAFVLYLVLAVFLNRLDPKVTAVVNTETPNLTTTPAPVTPAPTTPAPVTTGDGAGTFDNPIELTPSAGPVEIEVDPPAGETPDQP